MDKESFIGQLFYSDMTSTGMMNAFLLYCPMPWMNTPEKSKE